MIYSGFSFLMISTLISYITTSLDCSKNQRFFVGVIQIGHFEFELEFFNVVKE
jgi:hypothetical protein